MRERLVAVWILVASVIGAAVGGYYFGFASGRSASRTAEAAHDLLVPVDDMRRDRLRRESTRSLITSIARTQAAAFASTQTFLAIEEIAFDRDAFIVELHRDASCRTAPDRCIMRERLVAVVRHREAPYGEACAVALNIEPAHAVGIPLKREGRVRCSWDLATRLNRLFG